MELTAQQRFSQQIRGLITDWRENLNDVLPALKNGGILVGPQLSTAQSYLTFRNKALPAEWNVIDRPTVSSALGFVEELILKHFQ